MLRKQHLLLFTNCVTHKLLIFQNNSSLYPIKALNTQLSIHIIGLGPMPGYSNRHNCCLDNNQTYLFDKNIMIWSLPGVTLEDAARLTSARRCLGIPAPARTSTSRSTTPASHSLPDRHQGRVRRQSFRRGS